MNNKKQVYNPYLPLNEYIPDGEPHVFGDRVYIFGSHDKEGGHTFCMLDYVTYSAPIDDLSDWRYEGVIYKANQDPQYPSLKYMYAPDVAQGNDGRFYLYYAMGGDYGEGGYVGPISVAVSESPVGPYEFYGFVQNRDGSPYLKYICFDPAVLNDDGVIRLYYGTQYDYEERADFTQNEKYIQTEEQMFGRSRSEILSYEDSIMGPVMAVLCDDMITIKEDAKHIIPYKVKGTSFETHPFFEGSSMRKMGERYYFIYSSWQNHELCYATSNYPDRDFVFGGTIVSNGDVGFNGRTIEDKLNMTGTTHGSIVEISGQWYVFFHRLTHKSDYSRQALAELIHIESDGSIKQVEVTSCGLNGGPLHAEGVYPAVIACNITNGHMPHGSNSIYAHAFPNVTNLGDDRFIGEIEDGTLIGFKYFNFKNVNKISVRARYETEENRVKYDGPIRLDERCFEDEEKIKHNVAYDISNVCYFDVCIKENDESIAKIKILENDDGPLVWKISSTNVKIDEGVYPLYLIYHGDKKVQLKDIIFE